MASVCFASQMWLHVGWKADPGFPCFTLDPRGHVRISGLNVSWPTQYFPYVSMMEPGAGGVQLGSALCQVGVPLHRKPKSPPSQLGAAARPVCAIGAPQRRDPAFGSIFHLGVKADTSHMAVSRPTGRLVQLCLFIYFNL